jgi:hypothetical protein
MSLADFRRFASANRPRSHTSRSLASRSPKTLWRKQKDWDMTADALTAIGITKERVSAWLGHACKCPERQAWLNEVGKLFGIGT